MSCGLKVSIFGGLKRVAGNENSSKARSREEIVTSVVINSLIIAYFCRVLGGDRDNVGSSTIKDCHAVNSHEGSCAFGGCRIREGPENGRSLCYAAVLLRHRKLVCTKQRHGIVVKVIQFIGLLARSPVEAIRY